MGYKQRPGTSNAGVTGPMFQEGDSSAAQVNSLTVDALNNALAAATAAAASEAAAAAALDEFTDLYLGSFAVAPSLNNDGDPLQVGSLYYNSTANAMFVWDGIAWEEVQTSGSSQVYNFTATASQTVFNISPATYTAGTNNVQVYVNGLRLVSGVDYNESGPSTITLTTGATVGDEVSIHVSNLVQTGSMDSALVGYIQGSTGSIARNVQSKLRESVSLLDFGAIGDNVANDTSAFVAALATGLDIDLVGRAYRVNGGVLNVATSFQKVFSSQGTGVITKNSNGNLLTVTGNDCEFENIVLQDTSGTFTGNGFTITGTRPTLHNCGSVNMGDFALRYSGAGRIRIVGTNVGWVTRNLTASGWDIDIGVSGTATLYHHLEDIYTSQAAGGVRFTDCGSQTLLGGQIGKLSILSGTSPAGVNGGKTIGVRILGDVVVNLSNAVFTGNQFNSGATVTLGASTSGIRIDESNTSTGVTFVNNGNANNLIVREVSAGSYQSLSWGVHGNAQLSFGPSSPFAVYANTRLVVGPNAVAATSKALDITTALTGVGTTAILADVSAIGQADVTNNLIGWRSSLGTIAASFTLANLRHFQAQQGTFGAGSTITNQEGFRADSSMIGGTNNYGFRGLIPAAANRWNLFMDGTADNHIAGRLLQGTTTANNTNLRINRNIEGGVTSIGAAVEGTIQSAVTSEGRGFSTSISTVAASFTLNDMIHYRAAQGTIGAGSVVTTQSGFTATSSMVGAGTNYGFRGQLPSGATNWNLFMDGLANNAIAGNVRIGSTVPPVETLDVTGNIRASGNLQSQGSVVSPFSGFKNKIINGKMVLSQRGVLFTGVGASRYFVDRFSYGLAAIGPQVTLSQEPDVPPNNEFQFSARVAVTTADTTVAAGDVAIIEHRLEGFLARDLIGRTFTLSFWVRSSKTGTHCVSFRNNSQDRSFVTTYTINTANTWEFKQITVTGGLITAGGWNWTTNTGVGINWTLYCGTNFQTTANAWQTGNFVATSAQVNCMDTVGNIFALTGVQLEVGSVATPFEHRPDGIESILCQRYYSIGLIGGVAGSPVNANYAGAVTILPADMRAVPIMSWADLVGNISSFTTGNGNGFFYTVGSIVAATNRYIVADGILNAAPGNWFRATFIANAEL
jgi:hypothetical protein